MFVILGSSCAHAPAARSSSGALATGDHVVTVDGRAVAYHVAGRGPLCVVDPGGPGMTWTYLRMPALEKRLTLVYVEPPASGASAPLPAGTVYTMQRYADELERFRAAVGIERACFLGHSHGGFVVERYAIDHPDRVSALVVYGAVARADRDYFAAYIESTKQFASRPWFTGAFEALTKGDPKTDAEASDWIAAQLPLLFADWDAHRDDYQRAAKVPMSIAPMASFTGDRPPPDFRPELGKLTAPTLVIAGKHDVCAPEAFARELVDGIKGARLEWLEHSGHMAHLEEPVRFAELVGDFVTAHPR